MRHSSHHQKINATISKKSRQHTAWTSTLTALVASLAFIYSSQALAHGGEVHMLPIEDAMSTAGADVTYDSYADMYTITKNSTRVQINPVALLPW